MPAHEGRVFLCRHAQTRLNADGLLRGHLDPPLDGTGHREAEALGRHLQSLAPVRVLSSPLVRAVETAQAIGAHTGSEVRVDTRLIDRDYGSWAGRPLRDAEAVYGSIDHAPGVEGLATVLARALQVLDEQVEMVAHGPVVIVSHEVVNRSLLAALDPGLGSPDDVPQRTACWNSLTRSERRWVVDRVDQSCPVE
jgi:broad specificity phosphatase PhoE